jgi:hypothetical protein
VYSLAGRGRTQIDQVDGLAVTGWPVRGYGLGTTSTSSANSKAAMTR